MTHVKSPDLGGIYRFQLSVLSGKPYLSTRDGPSCGDKVSPGKGGLC